MNTIKENGIAPTILCIIDFSEPSVHSMKWAITMAKSLHSRITVIYPYRLDIAGKKEDAVQSKKDQDMKAAMDFEKMAKELFTDEQVQYDFFSEVGFIHDRIQEHVRRKNVLFAVIQKKIALAKKEVFQELVEKIQVPLVVVPEK